ncbi:hypothetical protein GCM10028808_73340 [Spirosoma migulaei]
MNLFKKISFFWLLFAVQALAIPRDSLPAGTKISISIQLPGDPTANSIKYTIPAPAVVVPPVVVPPVVAPVRPEGILYDSQVVGTRENHLLIVRSVGGKLYLTEDIGNGFLFRGTNLLSRKDVTTTYLGLIDQLSGGATSFDGLSEPAGVSAPAGYSQRRFADGAIYYSSDPSPPLVTPVDNSNKTSSVNNRQASQQLSTYTLEPIGKFRPEQFGKKAYSNTFKYSVDFVADRSVADRKAVGENLIQISSLTDDQKSQLERGDAVLYYTESAYNGPLEGNGVYEASLQEYYNNIYFRIIGAGQDGPDKGVGLVVFNNETSNFWNKSCYTGKGHWASWESSKNKRIVCELDGRTRTLEELDASGLMEAEQNVRRGNRLALAFAVVRERAKDQKVMISYGSSMQQGQVDLDKIGKTQPFIESFADVSNIGGSADGTITLNRPGGGKATYKLTGSQYQNEDIMMGYYYQFHYDISEADANAIWNNPDKYTYQDLWKAIKPIPIVADEKAYIQANREIMLRKYGKLHPIFRLREPPYEGNYGAVVNGQQNPTFARTPFRVQLSQTVRNSGDVPKVWEAPYISYAQYMVTRFFAGNENGWGFHVFPAGASRGLDGNDWYAQLLHPYTAMYQARADMQPLEDWYEGSTLVEDPDVKTNSTGDWKRLTGPQAYGYHDGVRDPAQLAAMLRYKANPDGSTTVYIIAGMGQGYTESSTHMVQLPGGGLRGNTFQIQLYGPGAHLFKFDVSPDDQNQTYYGAAPKPIPAYSGIVNQN